MDRKGFVLVTTLLLSFISLGLIIALFYILTSTSKISSIEKKYVGSLEAAKGVADYIIKQIEWDEGGDILTCDGGNKCYALSKIDLGNYAVLGDYNITAVMLSKPFGEEVINKDGVKSFFTIYSFRVIAKYKNDPNKKAIIDVVYELEE